jgi:GT2 family glycosyltransferase
MSFRPTVSVVVAAYNAQATLRACLDSLCAMTDAHPPEILVVDNASSDNTPAIIRSFAPRVQYSYETKRGPAAARNRGIGYAQGDIIAFTDADCIVEPDWLTRLVEPLRVEKVGIVGGTIRSAPPGSAIQAFSDRINDHEKAICFFKPAFAITMNWASPRTDLEHLGGFDEKLLRGEDSDLAWRILQTGKQLVYQPTAIIYHRNESTLRGLFRKGFQHGYYSVFVNRKHKTFLEGFGHRGFNRHSYIYLMTSLGQYLATRSVEASCDFTFNSGKKLGKLIGSVRAGYVNL